MIKVRRRKCVLPQGGLDPRIMQFIDAVGLTSLFKVPDMEVNHALITTLVERWRSKTHMFHLPHGEMSITLQDIEVVRLNSINHLIGFIPCQICLYFSN